MYTLENPLGLAWVPALALCYVMFFYFRRQRQRKGRVRLSALRETGATQKPESVKQALLRYIRKAIFLGTETTPRKFARDLYKTHNNVEPSVPGAAIRCIFGISNFAMKGTTRTSAPFLSRFVSKESCQCGENIS